MAYRKIVEQCIELVRQFYDVERKFRITGENGQPEFVAYNNSGIKPQAVGGLYGAEEFGVMDGQYLRKPEFDINLTIQKSNPFTKEQQNQTVMQLWQAGFFDPQAIDLSLIALEFMQFEGKDEMTAKLQEFAGMQKQLQQLQAQLQQAQMAVSYTHLGR